MIGSFIVREHLEPKRVHPTTCNFARSPALITMSSDSKAESRKGAQPYSRCVFVNCPFDKTFKPILDAILFAIHDCGFIARIALEDAGTGGARLQRIREIIVEESRFSIHDVSRVEQTTTQPLPRFKMAFECGVFFGATFFGSKVHRTKDLLVLDRVEHRFKVTVSDLGGQHGGYHNDDPDKAINCVRVFLARKSEHTNIPGAAYIQKRFKLFESQLPSYGRGREAFTAGATRTRIPSRTAASDDRLAKENRSPREKGVERDTATHSVRLPFMRHVAA